MSTKHICVPFASAAQYRDSVDNPAQYRRYLLQRLHQPPDLLPDAMEQGCTLHDSSVSVQHDLVVRRIKVTTTGAVVTLRPSCVMPYMIARTDAVAKALSLRQWGGPFAALASGFGRDALFWDRAWRACGRPALLGTTVKDLAQIPTHLVADEQGTGGAGQEVYVPTTVGAGCFLGGSVVAAAETSTVEAGYGECARAAPALVPDSHPHSVCTEGWKATREAWRRLFPNIPRVLCVLHAVLKRQERGTGAVRHQGLARAWPVSQAATKRQCAQRLRRLREWTQTPRSGAVAERGWKRGRRRGDFTPASDGPQAHRTSTAVDRLLNSHERLLYAMRYCHATTASARLAVRAMALQWHFPPYGARLRRAQPARGCPFHDLNGLQYHSNWWHNLLIASSRGGLRR